MTFNLCLLFQFKDAGLGRVMSSTLFLPCNIALVPVPVVHVGYSVSTSHGKVFTESLYCCEKMAKLSGVLVVR